MSEILRSLYNPGPLNLDGWDMISQSKDIFQNLQSCFKFSPINQ